ncbi:LlsX family protein [Lactiplantibacillus daowaiensis]|uniref:LlsX family protein n=1 Tax=Lactiplantibacillus daowaiensis TaxID=2559918 RepID=A0ABW1S3D1_9LACO|nr:LlsX family protein [Lactiplantibacillus daowaiensis]
MQRWLRLTLETLAGLPIAGGIVGIGLAVGIGLRQWLKVAQFKLKVLGWPIYQGYYHGDQWVGQFNGGNLIKLGLFFALASLLISESCYEIWHPEPQWHWRRIHWRH